MSRKFQDIESLKRQVVSRGRWSQETDKFKETIVTNHLKSRKEVCKIMANKRSLWDTILKVVIAMASAVLGALGANAMNL